MRLCFLVMVLAVIFGSTSYAGAESDFRDFTSGISCQNITAGLKTPAGRKDASLIVRSFITGANYVKNRDSGLNLKNMMVFLEKFCLNNPDKSLTVAMVSLDTVIDRGLARKAKSK